MKTDTSKVTIHLVSSLDGFIAKKDNSVSWFETSDYYEKGVPEVDPKTFLNDIDCFVIGSKTYELALELGWPYGELPTFVLTNRKLTTDRENIHFFAGDLGRFVNDHLKPNYKNIWVVGGATLIKDFIRWKLTDDIRLSILPIILGDGIPFLEKNDIEQALHLKDVTAYKNGIVDLWYEVVYK